MPSGSEDVLVSAVLGTAPAADVAVRWSKLPGGHAGNGGGVTVSGRESGFQAAAGAMVTIVATPNPGWDVSWNAAAGCGDGVTVCVFPASAAEVVATFDAGDAGLLARFFPPEPDPVGAEGFCRSQATLARADTLVQGTDTVGYWCNIGLGFGQTAAACVQFGADYDPAATGLAGTNSLGGGDAANAIAGDLFANGIPPLCSEAFPEECPDSFKIVFSVGSDGFSVVETRVDFEQRRGRNNPFNDCEEKPVGRTIRFGWTPANGGVVVATVLSSNLRPSGLGAIPSGAEVDDNADVELTAIPEDGWYVLGWNTAGGAGAPPACSGEIGGPADLAPKVCTFNADKNYNAIATFAQPLAQRACEANDISFGAGGSKCVPRTGEISNTEANCQLFGGTYSASGDPANPSREQCTLPDSSSSRCFLSFRNRNDVAFCSENAFNTIRHCLAARTYGSCETLSPKCAPNSSGIVDGDYKIPGNPFSLCERQIPSQIPNIVLRPDFDRVYLESKCAAAGGTFVDRDGLRQAGDGAVPPEGVAACFFTKAGPFAINDTGGGKAIRSHSCHVGELSAGETSVNNYTPVQNVSNNLDVVLSLVDNPGDWATYDKFHGTTGIGCQVCPTGKVSQNGVTCVDE